MMTKGVVVRDMVDDQMPIYPEDPDDLIVAGRDPETGKLVGWVMAGEAKRPEYWSPDGVSRKAS